ncbi:hypothetical protein D3C81_464070 [compost metagenome]
MVALASFSSLTLMPTVARLACTESAIASQFGSLTEYRKFSDAGLSFNAASAALALSASRLYCCAAAS